MCSRIPMMYAPLLCPDMLNASLFVPTMGALGATDMSPMQGHGMASTEAT